MSLLDLLFPKRCLGCGKFDRYICPTCQASLIPITYRICPECTRPSMDGVVHPGCRGQYTLDGSTVAFCYDGMVRKIIKQIKYAPGITDCITELIQTTLPIIADHKQCTQFILKKPIISSIPLHLFKNLTRGYNQAELIAQQLANHFKLDYKNLLIRSKQTKAQYGLNKKERQENVADSFSLNKNVSVAHRSVLLVDDVWTTGATMRSCTKVLKKAGVKSVWALTIAR